MGGWSTSDVSGDKSQTSVGSTSAYTTSDYWVVKLDSSGNKTWDKTFGGNIQDELHSLQQTLDGGYILGGYSSSGISGDKTQASKGVNDYWIVKLDVSGNKTWDKTFGGSDNDWLFSLQQTSDGGYILGGVSESGINGDKSQASKGGYDYWVVKLDAYGNKIWDKTIGGSGDDYLHALQQTTDGGYILGGESLSGISVDKSQISRGNGDCWVVKLDAGGNKIWDKSFGGSMRDYILSLQQTSDGGYILGGPSSSGISGDKTSASKGGGDYWIIKIDAGGAKIWDKTFGGSSNDHFTSLIQTSDGGYILGGSSASGISGDKTQASKGGLDYWVVKLDENGNKTWDNTFGGSNSEWLHSLLQTSDGSYILGGTSSSGISGDKSQANKGVWDYWIVKLVAPLPPFLPNIVTPNIVTPNHDGRNDTFKPQYLPEGRWHLDVYNRWGIKLYESPDYRNNWPDKKIADGTYYYLLRNPETGQQYKGWVEVNQ